MNVSGDCKGALVNKWGGIGKWKLAEVEELIFGGDFRGSCFEENSAHFLLKIELLFTMLSNFKRKVALKDSAFWSLACFPHKFLWTAYNLMIGLSDLTWHMVWYI